MVSVYKNFLFISLLLFTLSSSVSTTHATSENLPPTFTINMNPHITVETGTNVSPSFANELKTNVRTIPSSLLENAQQIFTQSNYESFKTLLKKIMWENRYKITFGSLLCSYGILSLLLLTDHRFLHSPNRWSNWKTECSFADLCSIPEKELEKELIRAITQRHCNKKNPTDMVHPLIKFINDIDKEISRAQRYVKIAHLITRLHLITIFPTNQTKIENTQHVLDRAHFIKHIFLSWLSEYNLMQK
jgi:hypothetical protein